jgi:hypothetical protein
MLECTAQGYVGSFTWILTDPTIATVEQFNNETYTFFNVTGLKAGTTTLALVSQPGGNGIDTIVVSP